MKQTVLLVFLLVSLPGFGQFIAVPTTIRTPYGNVTSTTYQYHPMYYGTGQPRLIFKKAKLTMVLKNDSVINVVAKYDAQSKQHSITVDKKKNAVVYYPNDTKHVRSVTVSGAILRGIPSDSCWLYKVISGKINAYSDVPASVTDYIIAIQNGDGTIVKLNKESLEEMMVEKNEKLEKLLKKNKLIEAIQLYNKPGTT